MRKRWLAGLAGASIMAFGAVILVQQVKGREQTLLAFQDRGVAKTKPWRSPADPHTKDAPSTLLPTITDPVSASAKEPSEVADDPVGTVESFLQRNRKEADDSIKSLTQEAEMLRARLQKVEAALGRWQAIAGALNQEPKKPSEADPTPVSKPEAGPENPHAVGAPSSEPPSQVKPQESSPVPPSLPADPPPPASPLPLPPSVETPPTLPGIPAPR